MQQCFFWSYFVFLTYMNFNEKYRLGIQADELASKWPLPTQMAILLLDFRDGSLRLVSVHPITIEPSSKLGVDQ